MWGTRKFVAGKESHLSKLDFRLANSDSTREAGKRPSNEGHGFSRAVNHSEIHGFRRCGTVVCCRFRALSVRNDKKAYLRG